MNGMVKTAPGRRLNETAMANLRVNRWSARFEGPLLGVGQHASGLMCVVEPLEGRVRVRVGRRVVEAKVGRAIRVPAGVVHEVEAPQGRVAFSYLEPDGTRYVSVQAAGRELGQVVSRVIDPRARRCLELLDRNAKATPQELASALKLSASRLRHLLREELGVPIARLRWWLQMRRAAAVIARGGNLTGAAHDAGFSDSAHLSRTFRRMFGFAPSLLVSARVRIEIID